MLTWLTGLFDSWWVGGPSNPQVRSTWLTGPCTCMTMMDSLVLRATCESSPHESQVGRRSIIHNPSIPTKSLCFLSSVSQLRWSCHYFPTNVGQRSSSLPTTTITNNHPLLVSNGTPWTRKILDTPPASFQGMHSIFYHLLFFRFNLFSFSARNENHDFALWALGKIHPVWLQMAPALHQSSQAQS